MREDSIVLMEEMFLSMHQLFDDELISLYTFIYLFMFNSY